MSSLHDKWHLLHLRRIFLQPCLRFGVSSVNSSNVVIIFIYFTGFAFILVDTDWGSPIWFIESLT